MTTKRTQYPIEIREEALAFYCAGLGYMRIANIMKIPLHTVKYWIGKYGKPRQRARSVEHVHQIIAQRLANPIDVVPLTPEKAHRVFLVCGPYEFRGKTDAFLTKIPEQLESNLMTGDIFIFCKKSRCQISALQWQGDGFEMMFKRAEQVQYPWPVSAQMKVIEINRQDLKTLLEYPQFIRRLSGLKTPENFE